MHGPVEQNVDILEFHGVVRGEAAGLKRRKLLVELGVVGIAFGELVGEGDDEALRKCDPSGLASGSLDGHGRAARLVGSLGSRCQAVDLERDVEPLTRLRRKRLGAQLLTGSLALKLAERGRGVCVLDAEGAADQLRTADAADVPIACACQRRAAVKRALLRAGDGVRIHINRESDRFPWVEICELEPDLLVAQDPAGAEVRDADGILVETPGRGDHAGAALGVDREDLAGRVSGLAERIEHRVREERVGDVDLHGCNVLLAGVGDLEGVGAEVGCLDAIGVLVDTQHRCADQRDLPVVTGVNVGDDIAGDDGDLLRLAVGRISVAVDAIIAALVGKDQRVAVHIGREQHRISAIGEIGKGVASVGAGRSSGDDGGVNVQQLDADAADARLTVIDVVVVGVREDTAGDFRPCD